MNDEQYLELQRRIDADIERVSAEYIRERAKRKEKAAHKPRKQSFKQYVESQTCGVIKKAVR